MDVPELATLAAVIAESEPNEDSITRLAELLDFDRAIIDDYLRGGKLDRNTAGDLQKALEDLKGDNKYIEELELDVGSGTAFDDRYNGVAQAMSVSLDKGAHIESKELSDLFGYAVASGAIDLDLMDVSVQGGQLPLDLFADLSWSQEMKIYDLAVNDMSILNEVMTLYYEDVLSGAWFDTRGVRASDSLFWEWFRENIYI